MVTRILSPVSLGEMVSGGEQESPWELEGQLTSSSSRPRRDSVSDGTDDKNQHLRLPSDLHIYTMAWIYVCTHTDTHITTTTNKR